MSELVELSDFKAHLGLAGVSSDDTLLQQILDDVEAIFCSETGRAPGAYREGATARTEVFDGNGSCELFTEYPILVLTSIKLGYDPAAPDQTLNVADKRVVTFGIGSRRIARTDGGLFGRSGAARYVHVVYDHDDDLPARAVPAIKSVGALVYRRRGSEEAKSETIGGSTSRTMIEELASGDPFWQAAVVGSRRLAMA